MHDYHVPVLIVGGSLGGVAAALACAQAGVSCHVVEECAWIGGQATTQGVPLDEHPWIEQYGRTSSYAAFREGVRAYYRAHYPLTLEALRDPVLNPGAAWVTALGYEPRVGLAVLEQMLAPYRSAGLIRLDTGMRPICAEMDGDRCRAVTFEGNGETLVISADYVLDATEMGDLLALTGCEHRIGAESQAETGEPLALDDAPDPLRQQPFTHLVAVDYLPGEDHTIAKPEGYDAFAVKFRDMRGHLRGVDPSDIGKYKMNRLFADPSYEGYIPTVWNFRRSLCAANCHGIPSDITMLMNGNEYRQGALLGVSDAEQKQHLAGARALSASLVYFLQTEIEDGYQGKPGFPGIRPRGDVFGTKDGLAQYPYIREARRMEAETMVVEQDFRIDRHPDGPKLYHDTVGLGGYRIDIHEAAKKGGASITIASHGAHWTQQIPLGSMIPVRLENLLPACKNLGVTHVTNGAFRLHPVEWNIGEAAGALAAHCIKTSQTPRAVRNGAQALADFQRLLVKRGVELAWPHHTFGRSYFSHFEKVDGWYFGEAARL